MSYSYQPRIPGLNITAGSFLPRLRLPSLAGQPLSPADLVDENALGVCIYNPAAVNPFPLIPRGVDLPMRFGILQERKVSLYVISGLGMPRLANWLELVGLDIHALSDETGEFTREAGIPIKQVEGRNFRTHCAFVLQEDRVLSILLETDPINNFEGLLAALDVAEGIDPEGYDMPDKPWYVEREQRYDEPESDYGEFDEF